MDTPAAEILFFPDTQNTWLHLNVGNYSAINAVLEHDIPSPQLYYNNNINIDYVYTFRYLINYILYN